MKLNRRQTLLAGGAAAFLAACGGSSDKEEAGSSGAAEGLQQSSQVAAGDETAEAKPGGTFRYRTSTDYPTLDPFKSASFAAQYHGAFVYSRLSALKSGPGVDPREYALSEDAATGFETADGLSYIYKLRPNNLYHNIAPVNGRAMDSGDVKFSVDRFLSVSPSQNALANLIDSVETPDPLTVIFKLKLKYAPFPTQMASTSEALWLYPKEAADYDPTKVQIGTGPFLFEKDTPSVGTTYNKSPTWWWKGRPFVDRAERIVIPEKAQDLAQFIAKRTDTYAPTNDEVLEVRSQAPDATLFKNDIGTGFGFIYFSGVEPNSPFKDPRVRRAVSMALDRDALLESASNAAALDKAGIPIDIAWENAPVAPGWKKWWIDPKDPSFKEGQWYKFNLQEAKALLSAAGYANGFKTEFHFTPTRYGQTFDSQAEAIIEMMKQLGLDLDVKVDDYNRVYIPEVFTKGNFNGMVYGLQSGFQDIDGIIYNMFHPKGTRNHSKVNMPEGTLFQDGGRLTGMVEAQRVEVDETKRVGLIHDIQRYASENMIYVPAVTTGNFSTFTMAWPWLHNTRVYRSVTYAQASEAWAHYWVDEAKKKEMGA